MMSVLAYTRARVYRALKSTEVRFKAYTREQTYKLYMFSFFYMIFFSSSFCLYVPYMTVDIFKAVLVDGETRKKKRFLLGAG